MSWARFALQATVTTQFSRISTRITELKSTQELSLNRSLSAVPSIPSSNLWRLITTTPTAITTTMPTGTRCPSSTRPSSVIAVCTSDSMVVWFCIFRDGAAAGGGTWIGEDGRVWHSHDGLAPHSHEPIYSPGDFTKRAPPLASRSFADRAFTVGIGGPVGTGYYWLFPTCCYSPPLI
jgi:hypothetical protein